MYDSSGALGSTCSPSTPASSGVGDGVGSLRAASAAILRASADSLTSNAAAVIVSQAATMA